MDICREILGGAFLACDIFGYKFVTTSQAFMGFIYGTGFGIALITIVNGLFSIIEWLITKKE